MYYKAAISERKNNPRELCKLIHSVISNKPSSTKPSISKINVDDLVIDDPLKISNLFNDYFTKVGHSIARAIDNTDDVKFTTYLKNSIPQTIVLIPPLPTEILNVIKSFNPNTASGYDNVSSFVLRLGGDVLAPKLSLYFSTALEFGIFPQIFKTGKVIPIFKSGDKQLLQNYRPISLLPSLSKVLEKLIKNRLMNFFVKHKVFYHSQYGFREKHSVIHALIEVKPPYMIEFKIISTPEYYKWTSERRLILCHIHSSPKIVSLWYTLTSIFFTRELPLLSLSVCVFE